MLGLLTVENSHRQVILLAGCVVNSIERSKNGLALTGGSTPITCTISLTPSIKKSPTDSTRSLYLRAIQLPHPCYSPQPFSLSYYTQILRHDETHSSRKILRALQVSFVRRASTRMKLKTRLLACLDRTLSGDFYMGSLRRAVRSSTN